MKHPINLVCLFLLLSINSFGQKNNTYLFIEPNISITYDSDTYKIKDRYSNSFYGTETYELESHIDTARKAIVLIKADIPNDNTSMSELEEHMTSKINDINKLEDSDITIIDYDKRVRRLKDFLCLGSITFITPINAYLTTIVCNHISDNDLTTICFAFQNRKNIDSAYAIAENFIAGFKSYTKKQVDYEDSLIKSKYTILTTIKPYKDTTQYITGRKISRLVDISINEPLANPFVEILFEQDFGSLVVPNKNNKRTVTLSCFDKEKGAITRRGQVVFLNSFGKRVKIPFTFTYDNR